MEKWSYGRKASTFVVTENWPFSLASYVEGNTVQAVRET